MWRLAGVLAPPPPPRSKTNPKVRLGNITLLSATDVINDSLGVMNEENALFWIGLFDLIGFCDAPRFILVIALRSRAAASAITIPMTRVNHDRVSKVPTTRCSLSPALGIAV